MKVAIAFSTKDRTELTRQTVKPLLAGAKDGLFDLFWFDGSTTDEGEALAHELGADAAAVEHNIRGGADSAIVYALTKLLAHRANYEAIGLWENDVLTLDDWFGPTLGLFERGAAEGLSVGAVSPRCFDDRILLQRDGYSVNHNLGAGAVIFTRHAANLVLQNYRTGWTMENRRTFAQLSGIDIGKHWAFRGGQHALTADWHFDTILARYGYASLALTPSLATMIGQVPSLEEQGLKLVTQPVELLRNDKAFDLFVKRTADIHASRWWCGEGPTARQQSDDGSWTIFPHQIPRMGGNYYGNWMLKWAQGFGPFAYRAGSDKEFPFYTVQGDGPRRLPSSLTVPISGPCTFLVSGGEKGGRVEVEDAASGYKVSPELSPEGNGQVMQLMVPASVSYRDVKLTALTPGVIFYGIQTAEHQPWLPAEKFDWSRLPPV